MIISMIAAAGLNRVIGAGNTLPWEMPADMRHFMRTTTGRHVIMGRVSFEDILASNGRPLAGRTNVVVSRQTEYRFDATRVADVVDVASVADVFIVHSLEGALRLARERGETEAFIIGGEQLFRAGFQVAHKIYLTWIHAAFEGNAFFPELPAVWRETSRTDFPADHENPFAYSFTVLERDDTLRRNA